MRRCSSGSGNGSRLAFHTAAALADKQRVFVALTLAVTQVLDLNALLFLTGHFLHLAGVVIGTAI